MQQGHEISASSVFAKTTHDGLNLVPTSRRTKTGHVCGLNFDCHQLCKLAASPDSGFCM